jgi:hypothetical protein
MRRRKHELTKSLTKLRNMKINTITVSRNIVRRIRTDRACLKKRLHCIESSSSKDNSFCAGVRADKRAITAAPSASVVQYTYDI